MTAAPLLVRPRAWWYNKVPLSVTLVLLLVDGGSLDFRAAGALALVLLTVCAVGNFGYALNDLYDVDEDAKAGRGNAALELGLTRTAWIVAGSGALAVALGAAGAGLAGAGLTFATLFLPMAYSIPPLRIKERGWLGVAADALAAHVFPAALALLTVAHLGVARPSLAAAGCVLAWSVAVGIRGILSHQLCTADRDAQAGLRTVVHDLGRDPLERFIVFGLLPLEAAGFAGAAALLNTGWVLWAAGALYLLCDAYRVSDSRFTVRAMRPDGQRYLPLVEESFYKAWGPLVIGVDAALADLRFLLAPALYALLFRPHLRAEAGRLRAVWGALRVSARLG